MLTFRKPLSVGYNTENVQSPPLPAGDQVKVAALGNIYFQFNYQNAQKLKNIKYIGFYFTRQSSSSINCLNDHCNNIAADILNNLVTKTQTDVNGFPTGLSDADFDNRVKIRLMANLHFATVNAFTNSSCNGLNYNIAAQIHKSQLDALTGYLQTNSTNCDQKMGDCH